MQKKLLILAVLALVLIGGAIFVWEKKTGQEVSSNEPKEEVKIVENTDTNDADISDWKTYRNEEYGFEFKYPKEWETQELMTAELGLPVDCTQQPLPKECRNFTVRISSLRVIDGRQGNVVLKLRERVKSDVSPTQSTGTLTNQGEVLVYPTQWIKKIGNQEFIKTNIYFTIYGSCHTTAHVPGLNLKDYDISFEALYDVSSDLPVEVVENYCSQEVKDAVFDGIVASLSVL